MTLCLSIFIGVLKETPVIVDVMRYLIGSSGAVAIATETVTV